MVFGIQIYWAQIFVLPKKLLTLIEGICRSFLWTGAATLSRKALVSWDRICSTRAAGGLNILNLALWNNVAILKQLWVVATKNDCLWIKWVYEYYLKRENVKNRTIPGNATWVVMKILASRKHIMQATSL